MTECRTHLEALSALLDGELAADEELALRRHLDDCGSCRVWRRHLETLSKSVASSLGRERAPRALAREVQRLAPARQRVLSAAAVVAVTAAIGVVVLSRAELSSGVFVEDHRSLVSGRTPLAVPSSDPGEVARSLGERLPFQIEVGAVAGAELRGGHPCTLRGHQTAYLQYAQDGEPVSVFVIPGKVRAGAGAGRCERIRGESLCAFAGPHETLAVVASSADVARAFRTAARVVQAR